MTTLNDLKKAGGFVPDKPVPKHITFKDESGNDFEADIFVVKLGVADYEALFTGDALVRSHTAQAIHVGIRLGDGKEVIPYDLAARLDKGLGAALMKVFNEVNGPKKPSPSASDSSAT